jgi:glutathione S-transferase
MIVYGSSLSPFVRKVLVFAAEKGVEVESRQVGGGAPPDPDFLAASPFRKIPALKDGDFGISDSSAMVAYIEKRHPSPALIPDEPKAHARVIWFDEYADTILVGAGVTIFFNRIVARLMGRPQDLEAADRAEREALPVALDYLESVVSDSGFLVGDSLTLADIAVASPFVNLMHLGLALRDRYPKTMAYADHMLARPSFAKLIEGEKAFLKQALG